MLTWFSLPSLVLVTGATEEGTKCWAGCTFCAKTAGVEKPAGVGPGAGESIGGGNGNRPPTELKIGCARTSFSGVSGWPQSGMDENCMGSLRESIDPPLSQRPSEQEEKSDI